MDFIGFFLVLISHFILLREDMLYDFYPFSFVEICLGPNAFYIMNNVHIIRICLLLLDGMYSVSLLGLDGSSVVHVYSFVDPCLVVISSIKREY